jgi:hypothetical protein
MSNPSSVSLAGSINLLKFCAGAIRSGPADIGHHLSLAILTEKSHIISAR